MLICTKFDNSSPLDPDYEGNYSLSVTAPEDTLENFRQYCVAYSASSGKNAFETINVDSSVCEYIDTTRFRTGMTGDSLLFYFVKPLDTTLSIQGIQPNGGKTTETFDIVVINPYRVEHSGVEAIGDTLRATVERIDSADSLPESLWVRYTLDDSIFEPVALNKEFEYIIQDEGEFSFSGVLTDSVNGYRLFSDSISVRGHRPRILSAALPDTLALGDTITVQLEIEDTDEEPYTVSLRAGDSVLFRDSEPREYDSDIEIRASSAIRDTGSVTISITITDETGLESETFSGTKDIRYTLPQLSFPSDTFTVPLGVERVLQVTASPSGSAAEYVWRFCGSANGDTTTTADTLAVYYDDSTVDTVSVYAVDRYGYRGESVSAIIHARQYRYLLEPVSGTFPTEIVVGREYHWAVSASSNNGALDSADVAYCWSIRPDSINDRASIDHDSLFMQLTDSIPPFTIEVFAVIFGTDTTDEVAKRVAVRTYGPSCRFKNERYTDTLFRPVTFTVEADDANEDGEVVKIFYTLQPPASDTTTRVIEGDRRSWSQHFSEPGTHTILAWAVDNEGFVSDTVSAEVDIISTRPYFNPTRVDTSVFIYDLIVFRVSANPGNDSDYIVSYYWDFDNDGVWDSVKNDGTVEYRFPEAGEQDIRVGCRNNRGDTAAVARTITVTVDTGKPSVDSLGVDTRDTYITWPVALHILAHDTNGTLQRVNIYTGG
jgi:hypothetical protein